MLKGIFYLVLLICCHLCIVQGHHLYSLQCIITVGPFFPHSLCQLIVVAVSSFYGVFESCSFSGSDFEVINGHGVENKDVNSKRESKDYSGCEKESNSITNEIVKCVVLPLLSLR